MVMKQKLEQLLTLYRKSSRTKYICTLYDSKLPNQKEIYQYISSKFLGTEHLEIAVKYNVEMQKYLIVEYGMFLDSHLDRRKARKLRIEWLKLLIKNYEFHQI